jgi:hypothetical protein
MKAHAFDDRAEASAALAALGAVDELVAWDGLESIAVTERSVPQGHELMIRGWALAPSPMRPFERFVIRTGEVEATVRYGTIRPDVAAAYGSRALGPCGFEATLQTSELGLGEHEIRFEGDGAALAPVRVRVEARSTTYERSLRYRASIERFGDEDHTFARPYSVQRLFMGVVSGRLDDARGERPRLARATIDVRQPIPVQLGVRLSDGSANGFLVCFDSEELTIGPHRFRLTVLSEDGEYGVAADLSFDVVPIVCGGPAQRSPIVAPAQIEWVDRPLVNGPLVVKRGEILHVRGWAIDPIAMDAPGRAYVDFDDGTQYRLMPRQHRPDIAERHGAPKAVFCGLVGSIDTGTLATGRRTGRVFIVDKLEGMWYRTDAEIVIDVG